MKRKYETRVEYIQGLLSLSLKREHPPKSEPYRGDVLIRNLSIYLSKTNKITGVEFELPYFDGSIDELIFLKDGILHENFDENMPYSYNSKSKKFKWIVNDKESCKKLIKEKNKIL